MTYFEKMKETLYKRSCPVISCDGDINGMMQFYNEQENLNYTSYCCLTCGYSKTEIREGPIKHIKRFYKKPKRKDKNDN